MSGHSKWATIKRAKAKTDQARGKVFSKFIKEITLAARSGGGSINENPRLRTAVENAKSENMPKDNIDRAIKRGTGDLPGVTYEEFIIEGYGPAGVALLMEVASDNRNRTVADLKHVLTKNNGRMGEVGCVAWTFEQKGSIIIPKNKIDEDSLMAEAMEVGAEDILNEPDADFYEVLTTPRDLQTVKDHLAKKGIVMEKSELTRIPKNEVDVSGKDAEQTLKLLEALEENDDVQKVYANFNIPPAEMERIQKAGA
jgi:YebC/PmpR family DNA-binding regulatory protein